MNLKLARSVLDDAFVASAVIRNSLFASGVTIVLPSATTARSPLV